MPDASMVVVVATAEEPPPPVEYVYVRSRDLMPIWLDVELNVILTAFVPVGNSFEEMVKLSEVIPVEV